MSIEPIRLKHRLATSSVKSQMVNILAFTGYAVSVTTAQLCVCIVKGARCVLSGSGYFPIKTCLPKWAESRFDSELWFVSP